MAARKKPAATPPKQRQASPAATPRPVRQDTLAANSIDSNRLLREAAWSRMFGRVESKNPFAR